MGGVSGSAPERYAFRVDSEFRAVERDPLSTFSIDVDTASYSNVRRFIEQGERPPIDAVRIEELLNYFAYDDPLPAAGDPFSVRAEVASCPWNNAHRLMRVALRATPVEFVARKPGNFVFLIDVSGSMAEPDKLPLVKSAMKLLAGQMLPQDRVAIVVYAGAAGLVLPTTSGDDHAAIESAIERLEAGGSTAGGQGIQLAYATARQQFVSGGINRVILATDGDFNVGVTDDGELARLIEREAKSGVFLTVLGFGTGNLNDSMMERLADRGNGQYAYIDSQLEAQRALVEQAGGTLITVAKDVKIQIEFNPGAVSSYRLIGYENRLLAAEDFRDDDKDAGEIGAGHSVVALYELVPPGVDDTKREVNPLKYQVNAPSAAATSSTETATVKLRFKQPDGESSVERTLVVNDGAQDWRDASSELRFAAAVASFGMILRESPHKGSSTLELVSQLAQGATAFDPNGHRAAFLAMVEHSRPLLTQSIATAD